jgi:hypothetical protein
VVVLGVEGEVASGKEAALGSARGVGLGNARQNAGSLACQDLLAVEVPAIGEGGDLLAAGRFALSPMGSSWVRS